MAGLLRGGCGEDRAIKEKRTFFEFFIYFVRRPLRSLKIQMFLFYALQFHPLNAKSTKEVQ